MNIMYVNPDVIDSIIENGKPKGLFMSWDNECDKFIAVDNTGSELWQEEFYDYNIAIMWLKGDDKNEI